MRGNITVIAIVAVATLLGAIYLFAPSKEVVRTAVSEPVSTTTTPADKPLDPGTVQFNVRLGETREGLDISVKPLEVTEDSRCPIDVQCIWAGTVKVRAVLSSASGEAPQVFELGKTITTETRAVTLIEVLPIKRTGALESQEYEFVFEVKKRTDL